MLLKDLSPHARGIPYVQWLRKQVLATPEQIQAHMAKYTAAQVKPVKAVKRKKSQDSGLLA